MTAGSLWPAILATWLSVTPVPASTPAPGAANTPQQPATMLPARRD
jgi:hypothetical protein